MLPFLSTMRAFKRQLPMAVRRATRRRLAGQFQPYNHTLPDRYPWLFTFTAQMLGGNPNPRLLSFGCSKGDEIIALAHYFPTAEIRGLDIDPGNIRHCRTALRQLSADRVSVAVAATTQAEPSERYDALFCLAVLCNGNLTNAGAQRCDPVIRFQDFDRMVADFARCLKPGGLLFLHVTNFRFCDTEAFAQFDVVYTAEPTQLARDVLFDRDNRLMPGVRYRDIGFRKKHPP